MNILAAGHDEILYGKSLIELVYVAGVAEPSTKNQGDAQIRSLEKATQTMPELR